MEIRIKPCEKAEVSLLRALSETTFLETFAFCNTQKDMAEYLERAYNEEKLLRELSDTAVSFFFIFVEGRAAGYIKVNETPSQTDKNDSESLEIERLYVLGEFQGMGLGKRLMEHALNLAATCGKKYVWLGVWEHNEKAKRFYAKTGFYKIGAHPFVLGSDIQTDEIMRKDL